MNKIITNELVHKLAKQTAIIVENSQECLKKIRWSIGESNTDIEYSELACKSCKKAWNTMILSSPKDFSQITITCSPPDINLMFSSPHGDTIHKKIELKSSKKEIMPGSTIKNLDINQSIIYCLRPKRCEDGVFRIRCSQYHEAIIQSDTDRFQDRSPRPSICFGNMKQTGNDNPFKEKNKLSWIYRYGDCALKRIQEGSCNTSHSWQDDLVGYIKKKVITDFVSSTSVEEFVHMKNYHA